MYENMTLISGTAYEKAGETDLTPEEAVRFLEEDLPRRSVWSILRKYGGNRDDKELEGFIIAAMSLDHPDRKGDDIRRTVQMWNGRDPVSYIEKDNAIELAFVFDLTLEEADPFVAMLSGERLHCRSPREIVYIFALQNKRSYTEASALCKRVRASLELAADRKKEALRTADFTGNLFMEVQKLRTDDELAWFLLENLDRLGKMHNTAYVMFEGMLKRLQKPYTEKTYDAKKKEFKEKTITPKIAQILREHACKECLIDARERENREKHGEGKGGFVLTDLQRELSENVPSQSMISKIRSRDTGISRKLLILLFIATTEPEQSVLFSKRSRDYAADYLRLIQEDSRAGRSTDGAGYVWEDLKDREGEPPEEGQQEGIFFETMRDEINFMLTLCGYPALDPRSPFDWIILCALHADDILDVDQHLRDLFRKAFENYLLLVEEDEEAAAAKGPAGAASS